MMRGVLMTQQKPEWIWINKADYNFKEKNKFESEIKTYEEKILKYDLYEQLLYKTDIPLEEAVYSALKDLGFNDVLHHKEDKNNPDITFNYDGIFAILEVDGTTKQSDKQKILELDG